MNKIPKASLEITTSITIIDSKNYYQIKVATIGEIMEIKLYLSYLK